ncbi:MAG: hypothetical protein ACO3JV_14440, partial [Pseudomonadales bacterium]
LPDDGLTSTHGFLLPNNQTLRLSIESHKAALMQRQLTASNACSIISLSMTNYNHPAEPKSWRFSSEQDLSDDAMAA